VTKLLVADDHPAFRRGLELMLRDVDDVEIVGEAETGLQAVELAEQLSPDVVLMDLRMPDLDGIEATRRLSRGTPAPAVVVLTMFEDDDSVFAAMRAGAQGYLLKGAEQDEIVRSIRAAASGEAIFGPEIAQRVIAHFASGAGSTAASFPSLTGREREVLEMVAAGKGNATIAHELMISLKTVRKPRLEHLHQTAGVRPVGSDRQSPSSRSRRQLTPPALRRPSHPITRDSRQVGLVLGVSAARPRRLGRTMCQVEGATALTPSDPCAGSVRHTGSPLLSTGGCEGLLIGGLPGSLVWL